MQQTFRLYLFIFCFFSGFKMVNAQDTIYHLNSSVIVGKVIEISPKMVKYKNTFNMDGPVYIIDKRNLSRIRYANGVADTFSTRPVFVPKVKGKSEPGKPKPGPSIIGNNTVYLSLTDPLIGFISASFEHQFKEGYYNLRIPVSVGLGYEGIQDIFYENYGSNPYSYDNTGYWDKDKIFSIGINLNYLPAGRRLVSFGFGPEIEFGVFNYQLARTIASQPTVYEITNEVGSYSSFLFHGALYFDVSERINISASVSPGIGMSYQYSYAYQSAAPKNFTTRTFATLHGGFQLGYKFGKINDK